ncbi:MAG: MopE-related protein [Ekhidna sp.]|uniref:MopE-related protein n=1 Tax=Ekhidna sp. TaxID=2608089 RepID=UPI0032EC8E44
MKLRPALLYILFFVCGFFLLYLSGCKDDEGGDAETITTYEDKDNDGFGNPNTETELTELTEGYVLDNTDCDDTNASINPDEDEIPDNDVDENCDGLKDLTWFEDADEDGFGNPEEMEIGDVAPEGYVDNGDDCDDTNADINPDAAEIKGNSIDENCDGDAESAVCGDGVLDIGEVCDDGNGMSGDGCNDTCQSDETCGNGYVDVGEVCDDGNTVSGDGCNATCQSDETCGNGIVDDCEDCDDGNTTSFDGCSSICENEEGPEGEVACDDMIDNDCNGFVDCNDFNCQGISGCPEVFCDDAVDNDGDGDIDCNDSDCSSSQACGG